MINIDKQLEEMDYITEINGSKLYAKEQIKQSLLTIQKETARKIENRLIEYIREKGTLYSCSCDGYECLEDSYVCNIPEFEVEDIINGNTL